MARIRTIKPDFCSSEQIVECSPIARLAFVGMWLFCDDQGVHPASVVRLKMEVFPGDAMTTEEVAGYVDELIAAGLLVEFEADHEDEKAKRFWAVTGWSRHQKIDRPTYRFPSPNGQRVIREASTNAPPKKRATSTSPRRALATEGKGVEGRSKKKEQNGIGAIQPGSPAPPREAPPQAPVPLDDDEDDFPIGDGEPDQTEAQVAVAEAVEVLDRVLKIAGANGIYRGTCSDVLGWLQAGYDVEFDILPTVESLASRDRFKPPVSNLRYFSGAIAEAHQRRTAEHIEAPDLPPELDRRPLAELRAQNARTICKLHEGRTRWDEFVHGPPPGHPDSRVSLEIAREFPDLISMLGLEYPCAAEPEPAEETAP